MNNSIYKKIQNVAIKLVGCVVGLSLFSSCDDTPEDFAKFTFEENLAVPYNSKVDIQIEPFTSNLDKIELIIGDSTVKVWQHPNMNKLNYEINANSYNIGAKNILLIAYLGDEQYKDERILRIVSDIQPKLWAYDIIETLPHNVSNFTQGLEFDNNQLYESTGQYGESKLSKIDIKTGIDINKIGLDANYFGEGITILGDTIYQLTWTNNKCFIYDKNTLQILPQDFSYQGEGWGICNDGKSIITSDGSERLTFRNPKTFAIEKTIEVYTHEQPVIRLNELEYVNGYIFANIWMTNNIAIIEPQTGRVIGVIDGTSLVSIGRGSIGEAFNGIAYHKNDDVLYVTGKNWSKLFKIKLKDNHTNDLTAK